MVQQPRGARKSEHVHVCGNDSGQAHCHCYTMEVNGEEFTNIFHMGTLIFHILDVRCCVDVKSFFSGKLREN